MTNKKNPVSMKVLLFILAAMVGIIGGFVAILIDAGIISAA